MRERSGLNWRHDPQGYILTLGASPRPLLFVIRDPAHPSMWRIRTQDGVLSDFTNLTRAKDAARALALAELNTHEGGKRPVGGSPVRFSARVLQ